MLLSVLHRTELTYDAPVCESVIEVRVAPPTTAHQSVRGFGLAVAPSVQLFEHLDWLGNRVHQFSVLDPHQRLEIASHVAVETHPKALDLAGAEDPLPVGPLELPLYDYLTFHGPVVADERLAALAERLGLVRSERAANAVLRLMLGLRDALEYRKGITTATSSVSDVLSAGAGVCQDFTHVAIALLRRLGVPTRYVSGYLVRSDLPVLETHAWAEAYLPSLGWVGFDPTHGQLVGERHVMLAAGRSFVDVPPNRGTFKGHAEESIRVTVSITPLAQSPRGLGAVRTTPASVAAPSVAVSDADVRGISVAQQTPLHHLLPRQQQSQQQQTGTGAGRHRGAAASVADPVG
jgi:transglutaminase-like putative cysteine protease